MIRIRRCHPHIETAAPTTRSPHDPSWKIKGSIQPLPNTGSPASVSDKPPLSFPGSPAPEAKLTVAAARRRRKQATTAERSLSPKLRTSSPGSRNGPSRNRTPNTYRPAVSSPHNSPWSQGPQHLTPRRPDHPLQLDCLAVSCPANARVPVPPTTPLLGAGLPRCNTSRLAAQIPPAAPRSQTAARLWLPLQTLQTSICQTVFPTTVFSPIPMDAATVTVISGNLVMPKNRLPSRTLQTSHCQLFFQARQHSSVENSAVQD